MVRLHDRRPAGRPTQTTDDVLRALTDERRQIALEYLRESDGPVELEDIAARVADRVDRDERVLRTDLHHVHLPVLDAAGLVEYDAAGHVASLGDWTPGSDRLYAILAERSG